MLGIAKSFFGKFGNLVVGILNMLFGLSILSNIISPEFIIGIAPFGFLFIPLFIVHVVVLIFFRKRKLAYTLITFALLCSSLPYAKKSFGIYKGKTNEKGLKVVSWNIKNFDIYNWSKQSNTRENILETIEKEDVDVVCLQEFYTKDGDWDTYKKLIKSKYPFAYFKALYQQKSGAKWGLAIFSKYPITSKNIIPNVSQKSKLNQCIVATIASPQGKIDVYNAHFQSLHFDYNDYQYIDDVMIRKESINKKNSLMIFNKILGAYKNRVRQVNQVNDYIAKNSTHYIICCDLNDIPNSYSYHQLTQNRKDAFVRKGLGISNTTNIVLPLYRIDYIITSNNCTINNYSKKTTSLSDHHMITAVIDF